MSRVLTAGVPNEILAEFCPSGVHEARQLDGGQVNKTYKVTDSLGQISIVQQVAPSTLPEAAEDFAVVSEHLRSKNWDVAEPLRARDESLTPEDEQGNVWRGYKFIPSDIKKPPTNRGSFRQFAGLLGLLHRDLAELDYEPIASIPHFHDFKHHRSELIRRIVLLDPQDQEIADTVIDHMELQHPIPGKPQLIHGDPKLTNALFRDGSPFTFIDWDTLMKGSPLLDVADMLRSMTGSLRDNDPKTNKDSLLPIVLSYYAQAKPETDISTFMDQALEATRTMTLGLAMRYLVDTVDGNYFQWDPKRFPDSASHNRHRALRQWGAYLSLTA